MRRVPVLVIAALWALLLLAAPAIALAQPAAAPAAKAAPRDAADVVVLSRRVVTLRGDFLGVSASERARRAERTIDDLLAKGGPDLVTVQQVPQGAVLMIDGGFALILTPEDLDRGTGESFESFTHSAQQALTRAIAETREARDRRQLLRALAETAMATLVFALGLWAIWRLRNAMASRAADLLESKTAGLQLDGTPILHSSRLAAMAQYLVRALIWLVLAVMAYEWLVFALKRFAYTRPWGEQLGAFLIGIARDIGRNVLGALPDLAVAVVIFLLARGAVAAFRPLFDRVERGRATLGWIDRDLAGPTRRIFAVLVWLFAIAMAYPYLPGAQSDAFRGISVLLGLMVTLGGSSLVGQAASGLILMYSRTIRVGEYVRINEQEGTVTEVGTFTTKIRTGLGEEVSMPNSVIMASTTKNYSRTVEGRGYVLDTVVTIGYDTPWRQVEAMLVEAARRTGGVLASPPPQIFKTALSDFYVEYRLVCQARPERPRPRAEALNALHAHVLDVFNESGVQIMSPHYVQDPAADKVVPRANWYAPPAREPEGGPP
ncbi:mechanosensitive ion channel family protein [Variovorax sp. J31P179]|uniref:mechanosensitive ion channel family protein n=1 Tax=Variovorax sp. J31P179 TaxID=3053508 RepID=UPI0025753692|nr:mechanosensitive ion channel family protein [Variovorax sp. J31P179]MDM0083522.1 mechanosensitive ion channel family protein [Variovorax sp. J31P179]